VIVVLLGLDDPPSLRRSELCSINQLIQMRLSYLRMLHQNKLL